MKIQHLLYILAIAIIANIVAIIIYEKFINK
jgi:hypothetical protein